ncbi:MAG TPA: helix-turn-helix domain-containing protein [Candidatus Eisenbergiella merdavium]|uniref:Helix-turn-helix domain-containing protein n=1 Tax=Candidatus Eisenbergiella merdavium TaxID=2838551 RepID=A0A9D2SN82_9FIRM|nr:helix-turn-helix domain-containing protein [Candidatus Eisenbergiella merdavium]
MACFNRIKDLKEDADLTQEEISQYLHISQRAYSHYENGDRNIPSDILICLADFYHTSIDYLLNRTDQR